MQVGQIVKFSKPVDATEEAARFILIEDNGNRVMIQLICDLPIRPVELVSPTEIEPANH